MNKAPDHVVDVYLKPGEIFFGGRDRRIRTILGSCVAITLWHPRLLIGGMCHYMLPGSRKLRRPGRLDGKYADDAMLLFMKELARTGTCPKEYEVKIFGGGSQFPGRNYDVAMHLPDRNVEIGHALLDYHGFAPKAEHLGGGGHRNVVFEVWSGHVWMRHANK